MRRRAAAWARWAGISALAGVGAAVALAAASASSGTGAAAAVADAPIEVVAAESQYGNVAAQIGGRFVHVTSIESNPNTDPHEFEASARIAAETGAAQLVVLNGLGYDAWADNLLAASPNPRRVVIDVRRLLKLSDHTRNPHLWYSPKTMPAVAAAMAGDLSKWEPGHAAYFQANVRRFDASLRPWLAALAAFRSRYGGTPVAVTEPVGDALLHAAGARIATPFGLQSAVMNGVDPSPQDVSAQNALLRNRRVKVFLYNRQVTDTLTQSFENLARAAGVPVVGVYETMPVGYSYQRWMLAETQALERAVAHGASTTTL